MELVSTSPHAEMYMEREPSPSESPMSAKLPQNKGPVPLLRPLNMLGLAVLVVLRVGRTTSKLRME